MMPTDARKTETKVRVSEKERSEETEEVIGVLRTTISATLEDMKENVRRPATLGVLFEHDEALRG